MTVYVPPCALNVERQASCRRESKSPAGCLCPCLRQRVIFVSAQSMGLHMPERFCAVLAETSTASGRALDVEGWLSDVLEIVCLAWAVLDVNVLGLRVL